MTLTADQIVRIEKIIHRLETASGPMPDRLDPDTVDELGKIFPDSCGFNGALRDGLKDSVIVTLLKALLCAAA